MAIETQSQLYSLLSRSSTVPILSFLFANGRSQMIPITQSFVPSLLWILLLASLAPAQEFSGVLDTPTADRWNYGFNATPGTRATASAFGYTGTFYEFDDRDGLVTLAFDTSGIAAIGAGVDRYVVDTLEVSIVVSREFIAGYDETTDEWNTYVPEEDLEYLPDLDLGRPVEIYPTDFRNGYSLLSWTETAPFSPTGPFGERTRNAFAAEVLSDGSLSDISNSIFERFTPASLAVGEVVGVAAGGVIPEGTELRFTIDATQPGVQAWLGESLNQGQLIFTISTLNEAEEQGGDFIEFYMRENPLVSAGVRDAAGLSITGWIESDCVEPGDLNHDCNIDGADLGLMLAMWGTGNVEGDLNGDGVVNGADLGLLLAGF